MGIRPIPYAVKKIETFFMDWETGAGVTDTGTRFTCPTSGGRKRPSLRDRLDFIGSRLSQVAGQATLMLTGPTPKALPGSLNESRHWLLVKEKGKWVSEGHWLGTPPTGRFRHKETRAYIEVKTAAEWFGSTTLNPEQARQSFQVLDALLGQQFGKHLPHGATTALLKTPGATGTNLWAASLPSTLTIEPLTADVAEEIHATSGQHHLEHCVAGPSADQHPDVLPLIDPKVLTHLDGFSYVDGRFMYASLCNRLGVGPGIRLKRSEAADLLREDPYARARFRIKFTVPDDWHHVGIFGIQHQDVNAGWFYPNRPGATGETWADAAEIFVAQKFGWGIDPIEAVVFNKKMPSQRKRFHGSDHTARRHEVEAKPLDTWAKKLTEARDMITWDPELPDWLKKAVGAALRAILIQSIGSFASRGRSKTVETDNPATVPPEFTSTLQRMGQSWIYKVPQAMNERQRQFYHPELAAQVWGRGRAKVLWNRTNDVACGALTLPGSSVIGINGDAVYSSVLPQWSLPGEEGGADDGKAGRLRLQGWVPGPVKTPIDRAARDRLRDRAAKNGASQIPNLAADQAVFDLEFAYQNDDPAAYGPSEQE